MVAPHTGAWIETLWGVKMIDLLESHPTRVRGLKLAISKIRSSDIVAPHTGAWIETQ